MVFVNVMLPKNKEKPDGRWFEVTVYDDFVLLERYGNEDYGLESTALTKEQALHLATTIMMAYGSEQ